jgi:hypothetical protein
MKDAQEQIGDNSLMIFIFPNADLVKTAEAGSIED